MKLYVRNKSKWINFIHSVEEFKEFEECYIQGRKMVIGDLAQFNKPMLNRLLKFIEENSDIDCYSSKDITDPILLSRFVEVVKEPLILASSHSIEDFNNSDKDYMSAALYLSAMSNEAKLRAVKSKPNIFKLLESL